jgi:hypothetical protein
MRFRQKSFGYRIGFVGWKGILIFFVATIETATVFLSTSKANVPNRPTLMSSSNPNLVRSTPNPGFVCRHQNGDRIA